VIGRAAARLAWAFIVLWAVTTVTFFVNEVIPSDPARMVAGPQARPAEIARVRADLGLDRPVIVRYGVFLARLVHHAPPATATTDASHATCAPFGPLHLDLGRSYVQRRPVVTILGERLPRSATLAAAAVLVQSLLGVALGLLAAARRGTAWDAAAVAGTLVGASVPAFLSGLALQYLLAYRLRLFPLDGYGKSTAEQGVSLVLPAVTLGLFGAAFSTRLVRDEVSAVLSLDHARTARAKGASRLVVLVRHGLRNALAPVVTALGVDFGALVGGAVVVEALFRWPGLGTASVGAVLDRDGPLIVGTVLVTSASIIVTNVVVDATYACLDPRLRRVGAQAH
jgi:peptide/nickel transport system permease protein